MFAKLFSVALLATAAMAAPTATTPDLASRTVPKTGVTHSVIAGFAGQLKFEPDNIVAHVGDVIQWEFMPANHSVVQSSFADPCKPLRNGSGFFPGFLFATDEGKADRIFQFVVDTEDPIWFYCPQPNGEHCKKGMVGVVNQNFDNQDFSLARHKELASKVHEVRIPPYNHGGSVIRNPNP